MKYVFDQVFTKFLDLTMKRTCNKEREVRNEGRKNREVRISGSTSGKGRGEGRTEGNLNNQYYEYIRIDIIVS